MTVLASSTDPEGRLVELTAERWAHVLDIHPEVGSAQEEVLRAVSAPDRQRPGRRENEQWYYVEDVGPSKWLKVVVAYTEERGWIVTVFARRRFP